MSLTSAVQNMGTEAVPGVPIQAMLLNATNTLPGDTLREVCCLTCKTYRPALPGSDTAPAVEVPINAGDAYDMPDWLDDWTDVDENVGLVHTSGPDRWQKPPAPETQAVFYIAVVVVILPALLYLVYGIHMYRWL